MGKRLSAISYQPSAWTFFAPVSVRGSTEGDFADRESFYYNAGCMAAVSSGAVRRKFHHYILPRSGMSFAVTVEKSKA
jgi:hypothetical protein